MKVFPNMLSTNRSSTLSQLTFSTRVIGNTWNVTLQTCTLQ
jgi:hypothetical protein